MFQTIYDILLPVIFAGYVALPYLKQLLHKNTTAVVPTPENITLSHTAFNSLSFICTKYHTSTNGKPIYLKEVNPTTIIIGNTTFTKAV